MPIQENGFLLALVVVLVLAVNFPFRVHSCRFVVHSCSDFLIYCSWKICEICAAVVVNGILRFIGLLNVAAWLGGNVFLVVVAAPALSSSDADHLLGPANFPFFSGAMFHLVLVRGFHLQIVCGLVASLQLLCQRLYSGRFYRGLTVWLAAGLFALALVGANVTAPKLSALHAMRYAPTTAPAQRETAARSLRNWQWILQFSNLLTLSGLVIYAWQLEHPSDNTRFVRSVKFRD